MMDRRKFLESGGAAAISWTVGRSLNHWQTGSRLLADEGEKETLVENPNWADDTLGASVKTSSFVENPPWGFEPKNVFGDILQTSWETDTESDGAWLEISFGEARPVREIWLLPRPLPYDIVLDPYMRGGLMATPRRIAYSLSSGTQGNAELPQASYFHIITLPQEEKTKSVRILIQDVWQESEKRGTGLGKIRIFPYAHVAGFDLTVYEMYEVHDGKPVQGATLEFVNPGGKIPDGKLQVSQLGQVLATLALNNIPAQSVTNHDIWIPAPFEDEILEFKFISQVVQKTRRLKVPAYRSYFEKGSFNFLCTNHNDLGWLDTQAVTADYRSAELILPAMALLKENPDFRYSMESVVYLREFLERHPEKREEMAVLMKERRFTWGASYVQCQEGHVGPEKLVRQFYLGRRWLKKNFPGADSIYYFKTDPPSMTIQMPQILRKAGVKYVIQGRFPWGFYNWEGLDGTNVFVFAFRYADPKKLLNPKRNKGWLSLAALREDYYAPRRFPPIFIYDFNGDYLPPPNDLIPYVHKQNEAMNKFAALWNSHYAGKPEQQISPPKLKFVEPTEILEEVSAHDLNMETVKGEWPLNWVYYDEPANREALLAGRQGHNRLLTAERLLAGLGLAEGWDSYPQKALDEVWQANCWPDHGWGGNRGILTDAVYAESYQKSRQLADKVLAAAGSKTVRSVLWPGNASNQLPLVVFNPVSWTRTDVVRMRFEKPSGWPSFLLRDEGGRVVPFQLTKSPDTQSDEVLFVADSVPSVGYRTYYLESSSAPLPSEERLSGDILENEFLRLVFGAGGLKSLYDKRLKKEILRTDKFFGGEILQFTAPGLAWDDVENVTMENFDKTSNHPFNQWTLSRGPVRTTAVSESQFKHFLLRQSFHLYALLNRVDTEIEVLKWDGQKERELRIAFPMSSEMNRLSYEAPFGTIEMGKDEADFSSLPLSPDTQWRKEMYGGDKPLPFREAINWIDASSSGYQGFGCLLASDSTVHLFRDETTDPVPYLVLQHVLLSTRKSIAWNPEYWFKVEGNHRYQMALLPHRGNWRLRYREGIEFNYPLIAFLGATGGSAAGRTLPRSREFLKLSPSNLILTAMKKSEDDEDVVIRFYEAEGRQAIAKVLLFKAIKQAWKTNLIEEEPEALPVKPDGSLELKVAPWEIVTIKLAV